MFPPFGWRVLNSLQRNLPKYVESQDSLIKGNVHSGSSSHWFAIFSALIAQDCLPLGLLFLVKQMQKVPRAFWCLWADIWKSPPVIASFRLLPWRLDIIQCRNPHRAPITAAASLVCGNHFMFLPDVGRPLFCLHVKLHSFCLYI